MTYTIILFYKYTPIANPEGLMLWHKKIGAELSLTGRIHIAYEGINATLEGLDENIQAYIVLLRNALGNSGQDFADLKDVKIKTSLGDGASFPNLKAKVKSEIVALKLKDNPERKTAGDNDGDEDIDPNVITGIHLAPEELKRWYETGEDFVVIDMRNDYEFRSGHFKNSINPGLKNFRDLPDALPKIIERNPDIKNKKVITVCTGGVRCEKASGYLLKKGFKDVYQLDGGMHMYMEKFSNQQAGSTSPNGASSANEAVDASSISSEFKGTLYTFDNRMTMDFTGGAFDSATGKPKREIVGECQVCLAKTERYDHCANDVCHAHLLVCEDCAKNHVYVWCNEDCKTNGRIGKVKNSNLAAIEEGVLIQM